MIIVCDINPQVVDACRRVGLDATVADATKVNGIPVSPANSFGFMDGGIDLAYRNAYPNIERVVMEKIMAEFRGELPVGQATWVMNVDSTWQNQPFMIVAPTMRTPATDLRGTVNAYLATFAAVRTYLELRRRGYIEIDPHPLILPGMGTASGRMDYNVAAVQMARGIAAAQHGAYRYSSWTEQKLDEDRLAGRRAH